VSERIELTPEERIKTLTTIVGLVDCGALK